MHKKNISRESALHTIAVEIDQAMRVGPVTHVKHNALPNGQHGLGCLESHLLGDKDGVRYSLHNWGCYGGTKATSIVIPEAPRGFVIALKKDSKAENKSRGRRTASIPTEAKTPGYTGDYVKIDWIYPHEDIIGLGIPRNYFLSYIQSNLLHYEPRDT